MDDIAQSIIELFELYPPAPATPLKVTSYHEAITITSYMWDDWGGTPVSWQYSPMGLDRGYVKRSMEGESAILEIKAALSSDLISLLASYDLRKCLVVVKETEVSAVHTDPTKVDAVYLGTIFSWSLEKEILSLSCKDNTINYYNMFPPRRYGYFCGHRFKGIICGYSGAGTTCNRTLTACQAYSNASRFGGFKHAARLMRRMALV